LRSRSAEDPKERTNEAQERCSPNTHFAIPFCGEPTPAAKGNQHVLFVCVKPAEKTMVMSGQQRLELMEASFSGHFLRRFTLRF
jgi:hypothetical protein